jgi:hypothetical protein
VLYLIELRTFVINISRVSVAHEGKWPGAESNCRHHDFQSCALPTELPGPDKKPAQPTEGEGGKPSEKPMLPAPRSRPPARAPRILNRPETRRPQRSSPRVVPTWETPPSGGASLTNSGGRIRTCDLRVMSPTSYQTAPPRNRDEEVIRAANRRSTCRKSCLNTM